MSLILAPATGGFQVGRILCQTNPCRQSPWYENVCILSRNYHKLATVFNFSLFSTTKAKFHLKPTLFVYFLAELKYLLNTELANVFCLGRVKYVTSTVQARHHHQNSMLSNGYHAWARHIEWSIKVSYQIS